MRMMKFTWTILLVKLAFASAVIGDDVVVVAHAPPGSMEGVVPRERYIRAENDWNPDIEKFPRDLTNYIARAEQVIRQEYKGATWICLKEFELVPVRLHVGSWDSQPPPKSLSRIVISITFRVRVADLTMETRPVSLLLDGTVATLRKN